MRSITASLAALTIASSAYAQSRHDPVRIITPPETGTLLDSPANDRGGVQSFSRANPGSLTFHVQGTGVPADGIERYGVLPSQVDDLILVRTREPLPPIAISPFQDINDRTRDEIRRAFPFARRVDTITDDLRSAQRQYLRESGLILRVRTFTNTRSEPAARPARPTPRVLAADEPLNVRPTRVLPPDEPMADESAQVADEPAVEDQSPE